MIFTIVAFRNQTVFAQFFDDFSNPDIAARYTGNTNHFIVNAQMELQLSSPVAGMSYLAAPIQFADSIVWEFYFRLEFDPSTSNRLRIWLSSSNEILENGDGLYLEIGESLNVDAVRLFEKSGPTRTELAAGTLGKVAITPAICAVRCTYDQQGILKVFCDYSGGDLYEEEIAITIPAQQFEGNRFFGVHCTYTDTRRNLFYFDNFKIDELSSDTTPPILLNFQIVNASNIQLVFNESLAESSVELGKYILEPGGIQINGSLDPNNARLINLELESTIINTVNYSLTIGEIEDLAENIMSDTTVFFQFLEFDVPDPYDIIFSELMVRPTPAQGLPGVEYIELYNRSDKVFQLGEFSILDGTTYRPIDSLPLFPGEYVILCSRANRDLVTGFGKVATMSTLPSLTDSGKKLALYFSNSLQIDWVSYSDTWYRSTTKSNGGYSLELINPLAICQLEENWIASDHVLGGSPGQQNSVWNAAIDSLRPKLLYTYPEGKNQLVLFFDKKLEPFSASLSDRYSIDGVNVISSTWDPLFPSQLTLLFDQNLIPSKSYTVIANHIEDCQGLRIGEKDNALFSIPELPESGDLIINEILFQAETGGSRFIELYNNSEKFIDLFSVFIADFSGTAAGRATEQKRLLHPGGYVAFTSNPDYIRNRYAPPDSSSILQTIVPTLSDRSGNVSIYVFSGTERIILDSVNYSRDFHYPLFSEKRGVSIERLDPSGPSSSKHNWYSASESSGFGTPGYKNSQNRQSGSDIGETRINMNNSFFTPNQDGYQDFLEIIYELDKPGYVANVSIYNARGVFVKQLVKQELLPESGIFIWDGTNEQGARANMGIYVVLAELVHPTGEVIRYKKECTLGTGFD